MESRPALLTPILSHLLQSCCFRLLYHVRQIEWCPQFKVFAEANVPRLLNCIWPLILQDWPRQISRRASNTFAKSAEKCSCEDEESIQQRQILVRWSMFPKCWILVPFTTSYHRNSAVINSSVPFLEKLNSSPNVLSVRLRCPDRFSGRILLQLPVTPFYVVTLRARSPSLRRRANKQVQPLKSLTAIYPIDCDNSQFLPSTSVLRWPSVIHTHVTCSSPQPKMDAQETKLAEINYGAACGYSFIRQKEE